MDQILYEDGGPLADSRMFPVAYLEAMGQEWSGQPAWLPAMDLTPIDLGKVEHLRVLISNYRELVAFRDRRFSPKEYEGGARGSG